MARRARVSAALTALMADGGHHAWTLEELQGGLARRGLASNFSSVFRAAEKLAAEGVVRKIVLADGRARFEPGGAHHDHLHCTRCGALVPVPCVIGRTDFRALERATGAAILDHHLILSGLCEGCRNAVARSKAHE